MKIKNKSCLCLFNMFIASFSVLLHLSFQLIVALFLNNNCLPLRNLVHEIRPVSNLAQFIFQNRPPNVAMCGPISGSKIFLCGESNTANLEWCLIKHLYYHIKFRIAESKIGLKFKWSMHSYILSTCVIFEGPILVNIA